MRQQIIFFLALALIISACAPAPTAPTGDNEAPAIVGPSAAARESEEGVQGPVDRELAALIEKNGKVKSISFDIANLPDKGAWATYYVRGTKARVDLVDFIDFDGWSADTIYLDFEAKTADARCIDISGCKKDNRAASVPYARYAIEMPLDWGTRIVRGEKTGSVTFNSRQVTVVRWMEDGKTFEAYIEPFYGVAQRVAVLDLSKDPPVEIGGYEYRDMAFNTVLEDAVTPP